MSLPNQSSTTKTAKFTEFSRTTNDFFTREFPSNQIKLESRTSSKGLLLSAGRAQTFTDEFKVITVKDLTSGGLSAEVKNTSSFALIKDRVECKSTTSLNSANQLVQQLSIVSPSLEGFKIDLNGSLNTSGVNNGKAILEVAQPAFVTTTTFDVFRGPLVWTDIATRWSDIQVGGEVGYDMASGKVDKYSLAVALDRPREKLVLQTLTGFKAVNAAYYQRFNDQLEVALKATWNNKGATSTANTGMEVGAKWHLIGGGFIKAKLDNAGRLGLAFATDLRSNVQLILGATIDATKMKDNVHKFGLELTYSA